MLLLRVLVFQRTEDTCWARRMIKPREFGICPRARLFSHLLAIRFDFYRERKEIICYKRGLRKVFFIILSIFSFRDL